MDGYKAWKLYMAVKLHFTTNKFNVFNNRGHIKGARETFYARNDRFIFEKLSRKFQTERDIIIYYVANFAYGNDSVVYDDAVSQSNVRIWQKRKQSITQVFESDLTYIILHMEKEKLSKDVIFDSVAGNMPELLKLFLGGFVTIESMVILDSYEDYLKNWKTTLNLLWEDECRRIDKCKGFVKFDNQKLLMSYSNFKEEVSAF